MQIYNKKTSSGMVFLIPVYLLAMLLIYSCGSGGGNGTSGNDYTPNTGRPGVPFKVVLSPNVQVGQINAPMFMTAYVTDQNNQAVPNTLVNFEKTSGTGQITLSGSGGGGVSLVAVRENSVVTGTTNQIGQVTVQVTSTSSGFVTVEAIAGGGLMDKKSVLFGSSGASGVFSPIFVQLHFDANGNGIYDENADFNLCQSTNTTAQGITNVNVKASVYYKGAIASGSINNNPVYVQIYSDNDKLVTFPDNVYYNAAKNGCTYPNFNAQPYQISPVSAPVGGTCLYTGGTITGTGTTALTIPAHVKEDFVSVDNTGNAYSTFQVSCQVAQVDTAEKTLNLFVQTNNFLLPEFSSLAIYPYTVTFAGIGGSSVFLQPTVVTGINVTANPTTVGAGLSTEISAAVNTTLGNSTAPNGTLVQFTSDCDDVAGTTWSVNPASTVNGVANTIFTVPGTIPNNKMCTVKATAAGVTSQTVLTIVPSTPYITPPGSSKGTINVINPASGSTITFTVTGGTAPYTVSSDNPDIVSVSPASLGTGNTFTATYQLIPAAGKTVTLTVTDVKGTTGSVAIAISIVTGSQMAVSPAALNVAAGAMGPWTFSIAGGLAPYTALCSNQFVPITCAISTQPSSSNQLLPRALSFIRLANTKSATTILTVTRTAIGGNPTPPAFPVTDNVTVTDTTGNSTSILITFN